MMSEFGLTVIIGVFEEKKAVSKLRQKDIKRYTNCDCLFYVSIIPTLMLILSM